MMKCPYCLSEISPDVLVCPQCGRDLIFFKPLHERIASLETELGTRIDALSQKIAELETKANTPPSIQPLVSMPREEISAPGREWLFSLLAPLFLLLCAHFLITQLWDAPNWILYTASILIPILPAYHLTRIRHRRLLPVAIAGLGMAGIAVIGMSSLTGILDGTNWLPADRREWRELVNYGLSIGLAFFAGSIVGQLMHSRAERIQENLARLAGMLSGEHTKADKFTLLAERLNNYSKAAMALAAAGASFYSTLGRIIGGE